MTDPTERPPLHLIRGDATPEEIAALVAVLSAAAGGPGEARPRHTSQWASHARSVRRPVSAAPGGWRASAFPR